jgi:hypothetical protein
MGHFRFHRSLGNKFVRLNVSKTGLSLTSGVPGAHLNVPLIGRRRRMMVTTSLPGTGLSYRQPIGNPIGRRSISSSNQSSPVTGMAYALVFIFQFLVGAAILWWIFS